MDNLADSIGPIYKKNQNLKATLSNQLGLLKFQSVEARRGMYESLI
jgi:hypothetical protein